MLAYLLRMDVGDGRASSLFNACGPCGGGGCLDKGFLAKRWYRGQPYYVGDRWYIRFKVEDPLTRAAVDLTNKLLIATFKRSPLDYVGVVRRSDTDITGSIPALKQIAIDDQTTDNGINGTTGRGWFQFNFASVTSDFCEMLSLVGDAVFDIRMQDLTTGEIATLLTWCFGVYEPRTLFTTPIAPTPPPSPTPPVGEGTYSCAADIAIGDVVYTSAVNTVSKASAASSATMAWGIVISKPSTFSAIVLFASGEVNAYVGLSPLTQYFLDITAGGITADVSGFVAGNIVQKVGRAKNATTLVVEIDNDFVVL